MPRSVSTFLMFEGVAEEAMNLYVSVFKGEVKHVQRYGPGEPGAEGSVKLASFTLAGHDLKCIDSPVKHRFNSRLPCRCSSSARARRNSMRRLRRFPRAAGC